jgi:hypothetical protein
MKTKSPSSAVVRSISHKNGSSSVNLHEKPVAAASFVAVRSIKIAIVRSRIGQWICA